LLAVLSFSGVVCGAL